MRNDVLCLVIISLAYSNKKYSQLMESNPRVVLIRGLWNSPLTIRLWRSFVERNGNRDLPNRQRHLECCLASNVAYHIWYFINTTALQHILRKKYSILTETKSSQQCDQIGRFIGLWATFQSLRPQLKSVIFLVKSFLGIFMDLW